MNDQIKLYNIYFKQLSRIPRITIKSGEDETSIFSDFVCEQDNSLKVNLYWNKRGDFVGIAIDGVDTGFWHTGEFTDLSDEMKIAEAALKGDYKLNRSKVFRRKEICFSVDGTWICCSTDGQSRLLGSSYIVPRNRLE